MSGYKSLFRVVLFFISFFMRLKSIIMVKLILLIICFKDAPREILLSLGLNTRRLLHHQVIASDHWCDTFVILDLLIF